MHYAWRLAILAALGLAAGRLWEISEYRLLIADAVITAGFIHGVPRRRIKPSPDTGARHG